MEKTIKYLENGEYHYATVKDVGDLAKLKTDSKDDLVAAINDLFENGGENAGKPEGYDKLVDQMADTIKKQQDISGKLNSAENDLKQKIADSNSSNRTITDELNAQIEAERQKVEALRLAAEQARKELNEQVAKLNADSQELSKKTTDLANDVENKFGSVQNDYKTVSENLTNEAATLHKQLGDVKNEAEATKSRVQDQAEDIGNIHKTVDNVSNQVTQKIWMTDLDPVKQQVTQNSTEVQETQNQLKTKAEQSSLDLVANSVEKLDTEVKQNSEGLEVTVKKEEFAEDVAKLLKDKTNLLLGTRNFAGDKWSNLDHWHEEPGYWNGLKVYSSTADWYGIQYQYEVKKGNQYTFSFYARQQSENNSAHIILSEGNTGSLLACTEPYQKSDTHIGTEWKRYSLTFQAIADGTIYPRVEQSVTNNTIYVAGYKLELGKVATPWEPNEADVAENIEKNESRFNVFSDQITGIVKKQEKMGDTERQLDTRITETAEGLKQTSKDLQNANGKITEFKGQLESTAKGLKTEYEKYTNEAIGQISDSSLNLIRNSAFSNRNSDFDQWQNVSAKVNIREDNNQLRWAEITQSGLTSDNPVGLTSNYFSVKQGKVTVAVDIKSGEKATLDNPSVLFIELYDQNKKRVDFQWVNLNDLGLSTEILSDHLVHRGMYRKAIDRADAKYMTVKAHVMRNGDLWFTNFSARLSSIDDGGYTPNPDDLSQQILKMNTKIEEDAEHIALKANSVDVTRDIKSAVDGIQVGGRNILRNTDPKQIDKIESDSTWILGSGGNGSAKVISLPNTFSARHGFEIYGNTIGNRDFTQRPIHWTKNRYIFSIYAKIADGSTVKSVDMLTRAYSNQTNRAVFENHYNLTSSSWERVVLPIDASSFYTQSGVSMAFGLAGPGSIDFAQPMLEIATKPGMWTPAPEDVDSQINTANGKISTLQLATQWHTVSGPLDLNNLKTQTRIFYRDIQDKNSAVTGWQYIVVDSFSDKVTQTVWKDNSTIQYIRQFTGTWSNWVRQTNQNDIDEAKTGLREEIKSAKDAAIQVASDQINLHVNELSTQFDDRLNKRIIEQKTAYEKITSAGIEQTVKKITDVKNDVNNVNSKLDNLQVGGRNLLHGTSDQWKTLNNNGNGWLQKTTASTCWTSTVDYHTGNTFTYAAKITNNSHQQAELEIWLCDQNKNWINGQSFHAPIPKGTNAYDVSVTFPITANTRYIQSWVIFTGGNAPHGDSVQVKDERLVEGNLAGAWTPNPEDVDKKIDTQTLDSANIDQMKTQGHYFVHNLTGTPIPGWVYVDVTGNGIDRIRQDVYADQSTKHMYRRLFGSSWSDWEQGAYISDVNNLKTEVTASVRNLGDRVTTEVNSITSKVNSNNGGGINLLRGTGSEWKTLTGSVWFCQTTGVGAVELGSFTTGDTVTYSITVRNNSQYAVRPEIVGFSDDNGTRSFNISGTESVQPGETKTVSVSATVAENTVKIIGWLISSGAEPTFSVDAKNEKLERGSVATPWSPAPEDTAEAIKTLNTKWDVANGQIQGKVTATDVNNILNGKGYATQSWAQTMFTMKSDAITLQAVRDNITNGIQNQVNSLQGKLDGDLSNLCHNPTFSHGLEGWNSSHLAVEGPWSEMPTPKNGTLFVRDAYYGDYFPVSKGERYYTSVFAHNGDSATFVLGLCFQLKDGSLSWLSGSNVPGLQTGKFDGYVDVPDNAVSAKIWVSIQKFDNFGWVRFTNVVVKKNDAISQINITPDQVKIASNKIEIDGNTYIHGDLQTKNVRLVGKKGVMDLSGDSGLVLQNNNGSIISLGESGLDLKYKNDFEINIDSQVMTLSRRNGVLGQEMPIAFGNIGSVMLNKDTKSNGFMLRYNPGSPTDPKLAGASFMAFGYNTTTPGEIQSQMIMYAKDTQITGTRVQRKGIHFLDAIEFDSNLPIRFPSAHDNLYIHSRKWDSSQQAGYYQPSISLQSNDGNYGSAGVTFQWDAIKPFGAVDMTNATIWMQGAEKELRFNWVANDSVFGGAKLPALYRPNDDGSIASGIAFAPGSTWDFSSGVHNITAGMLRLGV